MERREMDIRTIKLMGGAGAIAFFRYAHRRLGAYLGCAQTVLRYDEERIHLQGFPHFGNHSLLYVGSILGHLVWRMDSFSN